MAPRFGFTVMDATEPIQVQQAKMRRIAAATLADYVPPTAMPAAGYVAGLAMDVTPEPSSKREEVTSV